MKRTLSLKKHISVTCDVYYVAEVCVLHEFDDYGNHRLITKSGKIFSNWVGYPSIAKLMLNEQNTLCAVSDYYIGYLPSVFTMQAVEKHRKV